MIKNTLLGMTCASVLLSATNVSAITLYEKDGLTFKIDGDYQIQLRKKVGENDNLDVEYDDLELKFKVNYDFGGGVSAFATIEPDFKRQPDSAKNDNDNDIDEAYVGMKFGDFRLGIGKADFATDDFGVEVAYEMNRDDVFDRTKVDGDEVIFGDYSFGSSKFQFSYDLEEGSDGADKDESSLDLLLKTNFSGLTLGIAFQDFTPSEPSTDDSNSYGISLQGKFSSVGYGIAYSMLDSDNDLADEDFVQFVLTSGLGGNLSGALGVSHSSFDADNVDDINNWYVNITHSFHKNVKIFAEVGGDDQDDTDVGYLFGLNVKI